MCRSDWMDGLDWMGDGWIGLDWIGGRVFYRFGSVGLGWVQSVYICIVSVYN